MEKIFALGRQARKPLIITGYVLSTALMGLDLAHPTSDMGRLGILVLIAAGIGHIIEVIERKTTLVQGKIDDSVGDVYDAGGRARERQIMLEIGRGKLGSATVHRLVPRQ